MRCLACDECGFWPKKCGVRPRNGVAFGPRRHGFGQITARQTRCIPLPLVWGGVRGGGSAILSPVAPSLSHRTTPLPNPPPQGGGEHTEWGEGAHFVCGNSIATKSHAGPRRSVMAAAFGCGARRMATTPSGATGGDDWREQPKGTVARG